MKTALRLFVVLLAVWLIGGCSSGGGGNSTTTGQFVDDPVQGLGYVCSSGSSGVTSAAGEYICGVGDNVTFSIGPVTIGTIAAQSGMITPYSLFPNDTAAAYNLARLLQSLDTDPDDAIIIIDNTLVDLLPADMDFSSETFAADVEGALNITLVSLEEAQSRLNDAILAAGGEVPVGGHLPIADAGIDQNVNTASSVALDGSSSSDADGDALTYLWSMTSQPAESLATLSDASLVNPTFEADTDGRYVVELIVNDGMVDSAADTVTIIVTTANAAPVANAGIDQNVETFSIVTLDGSASSDVNVGDILNYSWSITSGPSRSTATLSDATLANPTFDADLDGSYVVQLIVNDGTVDSVADTVTITATTANAAPVANAGVDQHVETFSIVTLDGSASSDANPGDLLTYSWSITSAPLNSAAFLSGATLVDPTFDADLDGSYVVQLIVNDGTVDSAADTVTITATTANAAPVANAGVDQNVETFSIVTLDGSASSDANPGDLLTYSWSITSTPLNSAAFLSGATLVDPTFDADLDGSYVVQLIVNDGMVDSVVDTVTISATTNTPPVADAGIGQFVEPGIATTLNGHGSYDPDANQLTYRWSIISAPTNSSSHMLGDTNVVATFTPDLAGRYVMQLIVNDGILNSVADTMAVASAVSETVTYNLATYKTVVSPYTSNTWLDRNLGASQVCATFDDASCYGDYYQWGRLADGHQRSNSGTTATQATDVNNAGTAFITALYWVASGVDVDGSLRIANWSKVDGTSLCPSGYQVPTIDELAAETVNQGVASLDDAFNNFLKIPAAGSRDFYGVSGQTYLALIWSRSIRNGNSAYRFWAATGSADEAGTVAYSIGEGQSVRCIEASSLP